MVPLSNTESKEAIKDLKGNESLENVEWLHVFKAHGAVQILLKMLFEYKYNVPWWNM